LYAEMARLMSELARLTKEAGITVSRDKRADMVGSENSEMSISRQVELLSLNRTSLYY
jgi:hypothetical protein